ncbi:efflux RND transporter periplasmic adaptor subunit [Bacillus rubiinfantis]|uniref:efflux RND transporter periplasmic adaptor subunit n=1 Tax=Bacillus rubiinfantis TaxID=1499680 RepID=UPI0005A8C214|nr:efflux RND transporter periplasmic adaptor subunit [Bacillus rubiinfantis]
MKHKKIWISVAVISIIVVMIAISVYRQVLAKGPAVATTGIKEEEISSTLMIPGTVKLEKEQVIYPSPDKGEVKELLVKEGQKVKKGTVLAKLQNDQLELELQQNKIALESAYLKVNQADDRMEQLKDKEKTLARQVGKDEAKTQVEPEMDQAEMEKDLAELDVKQAEIQKDLLAKREAELEIKSTLDGIVLTAQKTNTAQGTTAEPIIHIGKLEGMTATGLLSEYDTLKVRKGQKVTLSSDAVPEQKWQGDIVNIGYLPDTEQAAVQGGSQAIQYPVTVKISGDIQALKPGFQVIMEIETDKKMAKVLPNDAVHEDGDKVYVFLLKDGKAKKQTVKTGVTTGNKIEIVSGVEVSDKVIVDDSGKIKDGMEVTKK